MVLSEDDVEVLPFEAAETVPATPTDHAEGDVRILVDEVKRLRASWERAVRHADGHDMAKFWHRKSRKVVLAVLLVRKRPGDPARVYHGTNMEVSMPTGSLCAERNVIGSALADDLSLKRSHLQLIAVLGLNLPKAPNLAGGPAGGDDASDVPCEPCWLTPPPSPTGSAASSHRHASVDASVDSPATQNNGGTLSPASFARAVSEGVAVSGPRGGAHDADAADGGRAPKGDPPRRALSDASAPSPPTSFTDGRSCPPSPSSKRHMVRTYPKMRHSSKKRITPASTTRIVVSDIKDVNPLRPCGACAEWLRKITEVNPNFAVVTFTDANCHGHFVEPVAGSG